MLEEILETLKNIEKLLTEKESLNSGIKMLFVKDVAKIMEMNVSDAGKL